MPSPRFHKLKPEKRARILEAAGREFAEHGYDGATINLILEHAGLSTGAAYYYFHNKADLFAEVTRYHADQLFGPIEANWVQQVTEPQSFWRLVSAMVGHVFGPAFAAHRIFGGLKSTWKSSREARKIEELTELFGQQDELLKRIISLGRRVGALRSDLPENLMVHLLLALDEGVDNWLQTQSNTAALSHLIPVKDDLLASLKRLVEPQTDDKP